MEIVFILILIAAAVIYFMRRSTPATSTNKEDLLNKFLERTLKSVADKYESDTPDTPVSFGFKMNWVAIKHADAKIVADEMAMGKPVYVTNWEKGVEGAYRGATFVTPTTDGWILIVNPGFVDPTAEDDKKHLLELSQKFGEIHLYGTHRVSSAAVWGKFVKGQILRGVSIGDYELYDEIGKPTKEELQLIEEAKQTCSNDDLENYAQSEYITLITNEEWVMRLAGLWSIDPSQLDEKSEKGLGYIF